MNIQELLTEDTGFLDITTYGLGIENELGTMAFVAKKKMLLCGTNHVLAIMKSLDIDVMLYQRDGVMLEANTPIMKCYSNAKKLHKAWKISQNILEYMSGIATYTYEMQEAAQKVNPTCHVATTRKNFPGTKEMMLEAVLCGGGVQHRMGLYDSILVFNEHTVFFKTKESLEAGFKKLKERFVEKKVVVEVESYEEASYYAALGADVLQCEKMELEELKRCVSLKTLYPHAIISATGGVTRENIAEYAGCGVDMIATSAPYHAKPLDVKVIIHKVEENE